MQILRQSTAEVIQFGPFVDKTDGVTLKTDATTITDIDHATTGIFVSKNGAAAAIRSQAVTASVADAYGMMRVTLSTTDTNTLGTLDVTFAKAATYLPVNKEFMVVPATLYDTLFVAQPCAAINKFFDKASPTGTVNSLADAVPGAAGGGFIAGTNAATAVTTAITANLIGNITGNLSGSTGTCAAATVSAIGNNVITAAAIADAAIDNATFAADVDAGIAAMVWDAASAITLDFGTLMERAYQMLNNKILVTDATGVAALRNLADLANIATGSITDAAGTTTRAAWSWI